MGASLNTAIFRGWPFLATSQEPETRGLGDGGRPRRATELAAYVRDVAVHGMRAQHELTQARIWRSRSDSMAGSSSPASVGRDCCCVSAWRHARTTESTSPCHGKCELPCSRMNVAPGIAAATSRPSRYGTARSSRRCTTVAGWRTSGRWARAECPMDADRRHDRIRDPGRRQRIAMGVRAVQHQALNALRERRGKCDGGAGPR